MKALILVHSQTGHTRLFAEKIADALGKAGHQVDIADLETQTPIEKNTMPKPEDLRLKPVPEAAGYDLICVGTPVWAFRPAPLALKAIMDMPSLSGKKFLPIVTMGFPFAGMGGNGALSKMTKLATAKGAIPLKGSVITYMLSKPDEKMQAEVQRIASLLK